MTDFQSLIRVLTRQGTEFMLVGARRPLPMGLLGTLSQGLNVTLVTELGDLDLLGEITAAGV